MDMASDSHDQGLKLDSSSYSGCIQIKDDSGPVVYDEK